MLVKTMFTKPVSIFMVFDSLIVGTVASYISFFSLAFLLFNPTIHIGTFIVATVGYSTSINLLWNVAAFVQNRKMNVRYATQDIPQITKTIILDMLFFRFLGSVFIMLGTIFYFFNKHDWNKVARTGTAYEVNSPKDISA
jgi:hypothetical protein